jgi:FkbM family methyltransferase
MITELFQRINDTSQYLFGNIANEEAFLKKELKKKIIYVDIGANNAFFYKKINKILDIKKAILIEPSISTFNKIKLINKNDIKLNVAISSTCQKRKFYEYYISSQSSFYKKNKLFKSLNKIKKNYLVNVTTIAKIFQNFRLNKIDLLKIDSQNEDLEVLKGCKNLLFRNLISYIKIELSSISLYNNQNDNLTDIIIYLNKFRYKLVTITQSKYLDNKLLLLDAYFKKY